MSLKERLYSLKKGTSMVLSYLQYIKFIVDELSLIGHPLNDVDLVIYALNGLGPTFHQFTASIRTRDSPILFHDLYDELIDFELYLEREEHTNEMLLVSANQVQRRPGQGSDCGLPPAPNSNFGNNNKKQSVVCQYCNKSGHSVRACYKIHGFPNRPRLPSAHAAQIVGPSYPTPPSWIFNSGASHHITNDLNNLSIKGEHNGNDCLQVVNGNFYLFHMLVLHPPPPLLLHPSIYLMFYSFLISLKILFLSLNYVKLIKFPLNFFLRISR